MRKSDKCRIALSASVAGIVMAAAVFAFLILALSACGVTQEQAARERAAFERAERERVESFRPAENIRAAEGAHRSMRNFGGLIR